MLNPYPIQVTIHLKVLTESRLLLDMLVHVHVGSLTFIACDAYAFLLLLPWEILMYPVDLDLTGYLNRLNFSSNGYWGQSLTLYLSPWKWVSKPGSSC